MDNETMHKNLHKKQAQTLQDVSGQEEMLEIPAYYGEVLFDITPVEVEDANIEKMTKALLENGPSDDLPPFMQELLKGDNEKVLAQLMDYYTRHKVLEKLSK